MSSGELKRARLTVSGFTLTTAAARRAFNSLVENYTSLQMQTVRVTFQSLRSADAPPPLYAYVDLVATVE